MALHEIMMNIDLKKEEDIKLIEYGRQDIEGAGEWVRTIKINCIKCAKYCLKIEKKMK